MPVVPLRPRTTITWISNLLLAGAVLHDVGKIYELSYDRSFGYTTEGQLLGHMVIGLAHCERQAARIFRIFRRGCGLWSST